MDVAADERELVRKLVLTGHLSVSERKALPGRVARASVMRSVIEELLHAGKPFWAWWFPDDSMMGCVIEYCGDATGRVEWRYRGNAGERTVTREHGTAAQAAAAVLAEARPLFGPAIDGVPIDWAS